MLTTQSTSVRLIASAAAADSFGELQRVGVEHDRGHGLLTPSPSSAQLVLEVALERVQILFRPVVLCSSINLVQVERDA